jgi:hypothetical protein
MLRDEAWWGLILGRAELSAFVEPRKVSAQQPRKWSSAACAYERGVRQTVRWSTLAPEPFDSVLPAPASARLALRPGPGMDDLLSALVSLLPLPVALSAVASSLVEAGERGEHH